MYKFVRCIFLWHLILFGAGSEYDSKDMKLSSVLTGTGFSDADLSLLSWLQAIPHGTFACPFEQKNLKVDVRFKPIIPEIMISTCLEINISI